MENLVQFFLDLDIPNCEFPQETIDGNSYKIIKREDAYLVIFEALGICKEDIKISIDREYGVDYLDIFGETKNELLNKTYSIGARFSLDSEKVEKIEWTISNGLLEIEILLKKIEKSDINIMMK